MLHLLTKKDRKAKKDTLGYGFNPFSECGCTDLCASSCQQTCGSGCGVSCSGVCKDSCNNRCSDSCTAKCSPGCGQDVGTKAMILGNNQLYK